MEPRLNELIQDALYLIKSLGGKKPAVSFSGGKDSLVALDLSIRAGVNRAVFADTTVEFDETIRYVNAIKKFYGIEMEIVRPNKSFFELIEIFGFPSRRSRWCCEALKFGPLGRYALRDNATSFITGLRKEESKKRRGYNLLGKNPVLPVPQLNPLIDWTEEDVWQYINEFSLHINPLYKYGFKRIGCWPCPFKSESDWKITTELFPDLVQDFKVKIQGICKKFGISVRDVNDFVQTGAWTAYSFTQTSKISGEIGLQGKSVRITLHKYEDIMKVIKLIPAISRSYIQNGNELIVSNFNDLRKLMTLVEKAINCIGCGACLILCKRNALKIEQNSLVVDADNCSMCGECLSNSRLRGACLRRNYAPIRFEVKEPFENIGYREDVMVEKLRSLCSESDVMGQIRSKASMKRILDKIPALGKTTIVGNRVIVQNKFFLAIFTQKRGLIQVQFHTEKENFSMTAKVIRNILRTKRTTTKHK